MQAVETSDGDRHNQKAGSVDRRGAKAEEELDFQSDMENAVLVGGGSEAVSGEGDEGDEGGEEGVPGGALFFGSPEDDSKGNGQEEDWVVEEGVNWQKINKKRGTGDGDDQKPDKKTHHSFLRGGTNKEAGEVLGLGDAAQESQEGDGALRISSVQGNLAETDAPGEAVGSEKGGPLEHDPPAVGEPSSRDDGWVGDSEGGAGGETEVPAKVAGVDGLDGGVVVGGAVPEELAALDRRDVARVTAGDGGQVVTEEDQEDKKEDKEEQEEEKEEDKEEDKEDKEEEEKEEETKEKAAVGSVEVKEEVPSKHEKHEQEAETKEAREAREKYLEGVAAANGQGGPLVALVEAAKARAKEEHNERSAPRAARSGEAKRKKEVEDAVIAAANADGAAAADAAAAAAALSGFALEQPDNQEDKTREERQRKAEEAGQERKTRKEAVAAADAAGGPAEAKRAGGQKGGAGENPAKEAARAPLKKVAMDDSEGEQIHSSPSFDGGRREGAHWHENRAGNQHGGSRGHHQQPQMPRGGGEDDEDDDRWDNRGRREDSRDEVSSEGSSWNVAVRTDDSTEAGGGVSRDSDGSDGRGGLRQSGRRFHSQDRRGGIDINEDDDESTEVALRRKNQNRPPAPQVPETVKSRRDKATRDFFAAA